jgi:hypothetical protein
VAPRFVYRIRLFREVNHEVVSNYFWAGTNAFFPEEHHPVQAMARAYQILVATAPVRSVLDRATSWTADAYEVSPWHRVALGISGYIPWLVGHGVVLGMVSPPFLAVPIDRVNATVRDTRLWWRHLPVDYVSEFGYLEPWGVVAFALAFAAISSITLAVSPARGIVEETPFAVRPELQAYKKGRRPLPIGG